jgi:hypothetical protein
MAKKTARLYFAVEYDDSKTDAESVATALDALMETALSTPGVLDEYGPVDVGEFLVGSADTGSVLV